MALIKCLECKHEISEFSNQCVYCGCPMTKIKSILEEEKRKIFLYANKLVDGNEKDEIIIRTMFDNLYNLQDLESGAIPTLVDSTKYWNKLLSNK